MSDDGDHGNPPMDDGGTADATIDDPTLIGAVQQHPLIYDSALPDYKCIPNRERAWLSVSVDVGVSALQCQRRWKCLRDKLLRQVKKDVLFRKGKGNGAHTWHLRPQLEFLVPFLTYRKVESGVELPLTQQLRSTMDEFLDGIMVRDENKNHVNDQDESTQASLDLEEHLISSVAAQISSSSPSQSSPGISDSCRVKPKAAEERSELLNMLRSVVDNAVQRRQTKRQASDGISPFALEVDEELSTLNPKQRSLAKARIMQAIYDVRFGDG